MAFQGDVNVPYGKHSFVAELDKKLVLTDAHQETINGWVISYHYGYMVPI